MEVEMEGDASVWPDSFFVSKGKNYSICITFERRMILKTQSALCQRGIRGHHAHV